MLGLSVPRWNRRTGGSRRFGRFVVPVAVLALAFAYPYYDAQAARAADLPAVPEMSTTVIAMVIFVMMALGLNIVVGYAGLLDLGYVAFYAIGAYTAGWFASSQFAHGKVNFGGVGVPRCAGIHLSIWLVLPMAGILTAVAGVLIGLPTLRLRGRLSRDRHARLRRDPAAGRAQRRQPLRDEHQPDERPAGDQPDRPAGLRQLAARHTSVCRRTSSPLAAAAQGTRSTSSSGLRSCSCLFAIFCSPRLRDSRLGRAWVAIREDETAAAAMGIPLMRTKTWAYAIGAFFGGIAGAYYAATRAVAFPR